jgi:hypothetical protein
MRAAVLLLAAVLAIPAPASAQQAERLLAEADANNDMAIDETELQAFLTKTLRDRLATLGATPDEAAFPRIVRHIAENILNVTNDGNSTLSDAEIGMVLGTQLAGYVTTVSDLLPPDEPSAASPKTVWERIDDWVDIRQSFLDDKAIGKPAKLSLATYARSDETLEEGAPRRQRSIAAAVILKPNLEWGSTSAFPVRPIVAWEATLSGHEPEKDQVVHRFGLAGTLLHPRANAAISSHEIELTFDYRTDRGYDARVLGGTFQYSPNARKAGIGQFLGGPDSPVRFRWRPFMGVVVADVQIAGEVTAYTEMSSFTHWFARAAAEINIGDWLRVTPESELWRGSRLLPDGEKDRWQSMLSLSTRLVLLRTDDTDRFSIELALKRGRTSPDFDFAQSADLGFAVKF